MSGGNGDRLAQAIEKLCLIIGAQFAEKLGDLDQRIKADRLKRCGFSTAEIAQLLGVSGAAARMAVHRAKKARKRGARRAGRR
jgi:hypothetical protein